MSKGENNPEASICCFYDGNGMIWVDNGSFVADCETPERFRNEDDRRFFGKGIDDPKIRLLEFHTNEATFGSAKGSVLVNTRIEALWFSEECAFPLHSLVNGCFCTA